MIAFRTAPRDCRLLRERPASRCPETREAALFAIEHALVQDIEARDETLAALEACGVIPRASIRALRVELAPRHCRDTLAEPVVGDSDDPALTSLLRGQTIEGRLEQIGRDAPPVPFDRLTTFFDDELTPWVDEERRLMRETARAAPKTGVGVPIVSFAYGRALLRLSDQLRSAVRAMPTCGQPQPRGRHGRYGPVERCEFEPERAETQVTAAILRAEKLERRGLAALRHGLAGYNDIGVMYDARANEARAHLVQAAAGGSAPGPSSMTLSAGSPAVSARLARALPPAAISVLLAPPEAPPSPQAPAVPGQAGPAADCIGPASETGSSGLALPRGGALMTGR